MSANTLYHPIYNNICTPARIYVTVHTDTHVYQPMYSIYVSHYSYTIHQLLSILRQLLYILPYCPYVCICYGIQIPYIHGAVGCGVLSSA